MLRFIYSVRAFTNCLIYDNIVESLARKDIAKYTEIFIKFCQYFHDWEINVQHLENPIHFVENIEKQKLDHFFSTLRKECTLAIFLIFSSTGDSDENNDESGHKPLRESLTYK